MRKGEWDQIVEPKVEELSDPWSDNVDVHVYINNHYEGSAPKSIQRINELL